MILMSVASPMPAKSDNGSISFEHSDNKRGLSAKTLMLSITLKWALADFLNVNRRRNLRSILWMGDT